jgi:pantetheine-phosphate adenylyltransferase
MTRVAVYPGSFDPITNGHLDIIRRAARMFDELHVGILINVSKASTFSVNERIDLIRLARKEVDLPAIHIDTFTGLVTDYAASRNATVIVRGLRTITDFDFEFQFAHVVRQLDPEMEVVLLPTVEGNSYVSSSIVKDLAAHGGDLSKFVPRCVAEALRQRYNRSRNIERS